MEIIHTEHDGVPYAIELPDAVLATTPRDQIPAYVAAAVRERAASGLSPAPVPQPAESSAITEEE